MKTQLPTIENNIESHPAYGSISVTSPAHTPATKLFGSDLSHNHTISISIHSAEMERRYGSEWIYGKKRIMNIELSHAQFAHMISSVGGTDTPCTLRYVNNETLPLISENTTNESTIKQEFEKTIKTSVEGLDKTIQQVTELLYKGRVNKSDLTAILQIIKTTKQNITDNLPFFVDQFDRHIESQKDEAIAQIESSIAINLKEIGMATALRNNHLKQEST